MIQILLRRQKFSILFIVKRLKFVVNHIRSGFTMNGLDKPAVFTRADASVSRRCDHLRSRLREYGLASGVKANSKLRFRSLVKRFFYTASERQTGREPQPAAPTPTATRKPSRQSQRNPTNNDLRFAPVIHPTLQTGVEALIVAGRAWLEP